MIAACVRSPLDEPPARAARMARSSAPIAIAVLSFCRAIIRAMWRWVTWPISWPSTLASSDSLWDVTTRPVCTPMKPPGSANALSIGSRMMKNTKSSDREGLTETRR